MTIKDGIKKINGLVEDLRKKEEARVARKKIRSRIEGELTKRAILAASKQKKRSRSSSASLGMDDGGKKTKRKKKTSKKEIP